MEREPAIRQLTIRNLLSFSPQGATIDLRNLNVLIGANGSGKSNFLEVIGLLKGTSRDLAKAISIGGPIDEWLWKGSPKSEFAYIEAVTTGLTGRKDLRYILTFQKVASRFAIRSEEVQIHEDGQPWDTIYFNVPSGPPHITTRGVDRELRQEDINPRLSILAQRKDPDAYPEITYLGDLFNEIALHRNWEFGPRSRLREACDPSLEASYLEDDGSNLSVVLDRLLAKPLVRRQMIESLRTFYDNVEDLRSTVDGGSVQTRIEERGLNTSISLLRMSDGTVRWLALLAVLLNPDPSPVVVIEEPELGLHPDMIHELAKLLVDASSRTQIVITTHSPQLIEEFSDNPESVIVCEKENGASTLRRLDAKRLSAWLEEYSLGQLWTKGQIGGTRW